MGDKAITSQRLLEAEIISALQLWRVPLDRNKEGDHIVDLSADLPELNITALAQELAERFDFRRKRA